VKRNPRPPTYIPLLALALSLACGPKAGPEASAPDMAPPQASAPAPAPEPLVDAWYNDVDDDGIPDFVELELHRDPRLDECITEACGKDARGGQPVQAINTLIILDVSGSMAGKIAGKRTTKLELAKQAVTRYVETMPDVAVMKVGLMVYGHKGANTEAAKEESCQAFETLLPLGPVEPKAITAALKPLNPTGWSPIAGALEASAKVVPEEVGEMNHIILVADGIERCGGDPVAMARRLRDTNHLTVVDVVGLGVGANEDAPLLREIATATGGTYQEAATVAEFDQAFNTLNYNLWRTLDTWMCAVGSEPLMACYQARAAEAIARTEQEIEAMARRASDGEKYIADLKKIKARTETMRDGRARVVTTYKVKLAEIQAAAAKRRPKAPV
jgi:hypothetical protein